MLKPLVVVAALPAVPVLWVLAQTGSNEPAPPAMPFANMGQVWLALIVFAQGIINHIAGARRERRNREWLIEDRREQQGQAEKIATAIRAELLSEARDIKSEAWKRTDAITDKIDENTRVSTDAFKEASKAVAVGNHVSDKILAVGGVRQSTEKRRVDDEKGGTT